MLFLLVFSLKGFSVQPSSLNFTSINSQILTIQNNDSVNESITILPVGSSASFFSLSNTSLQLSVNATAVVNVSVINNPNGFLTGEFVFLSSSNQIIVPNSINITSSGGSVGQELSVIPTMHSVYLTTSDNTYNSINTITNNGNNTINIQNVVLEPESNFISLGSFNLQPLSPGQSETIPVVINPQQATPGVYTGNLAIFGVDSQGNYLNSTVSYSVTIQGASSYTGNANSTIQIPAFTPVNTPFNILIANLQPSETVSVLFNPMEGVSCNPSATSYSNGFWSTQCVIVNSGIYNVQVTIFYTNKNANVPINSWNQDLLVGLNSNDLSFKFTPPFNPGQTSIIQLVDNSTGNVVFSNAQFTINGNNSGNTINPTPGKQYTICALLSGQNNICTTLNTPLLPMVITASPSQPSEGQAVTLTATSNGNPIQPVFYLNGAPLQGNTFTASIGTEVITAQLDGYNQGSLTITPTPIVNNLQSYPYGSNIQLTVTPASNWTVLYAPNSEVQPTIIASGYSNQIQLNNTQAGSYTIQTNGQTIGSFTVSNPSILDLIPSWGYDLIAGFFIMVLLLVIWIFFKGREEKRKNSASIGGWGVSKEEPRKISFSERSGKTWKVLKKRWLLTNESTDIPII